MKRQSQFHALEYIVDSDLKRLFGVHVRMTIEKAEVFFLRGRKVSLRQFASSELKNSEAGAKVVGEDELKASKTE